MPESREGSHALSRLETGAPIRTDNFEMQWSNSQFLFELFLRVGLQNVQLRLQLLLFLSGHPIDEKDAIQVIDLMLHRPGQ